MAFTLPPLPYDYNALEKAIDEETMHLHHDKHHAAYVNNLNAALEKHPELANKTLVDLLKNLNQVPEDIRTAVRNNGGGDYNHSLFWLMMGPNGGGQPSGELANAINQAFGSLDNFKSQFKQAAVSRFGSGWAWLVVNPDGSLAVESTPNQDNPIMTSGKHGILGVDVWEHAYYLRYQNRRPEYVDKWWEVVNWPQIEQYYQKAKSGQQLLNV